MHTPHPPDSKGLRRSRAILWTVVPGLAPFTRMMGEVDAAPLMTVCPPGGTWTGRAVEAWPAANIPPKGPASSWFNEANNDRLADVGISGADDSNSSALSDMAGHSLWSSTVEKLS